MKREYSLSLWEEKGKEGVNQHLDPQWLTATANLVISDGSLTPFCLLRNIGQCLKLL